MSYARVQEFMREQKIDAWLVFDFRLNNPVLTRMMGGGKFHVTRRLFWMLPAAGEPRCLCQTIDDAAFKKLGWPYTTYSGWRDMQEKVAALIGNSRRVAMEYSPGGALPTAGIVDAGTIEFVRSLGVEVVSSADLIQIHAAAWGERGLASHKDASTKCARIMEESFAFIGQKLASGAPVTENDGQRFIRERFQDAGLITDSGPIVSVNANAADCHYEADEKTFKPINKGDWVLIDLWAKQPGDDTVYADITWTGYCGKEVPADKRRVFETVRAARDAAVAAAQAAWKAGATIEGWQLDDAARKVIIDAGFANAIKHRTGHSLSPGTAGAHGIGMNLDNMETHDTRRVMPGTGFTVEPGVYLDGNFGVRNEINVYVDPKQGPVVTSCSQREIVLIG